MSQPQKTEYDVIVIGAGAAGGLPVGAYLQKARLWSANLQEANLREANLQKADLRSANVENARLAFASLDGAIYGANT